MTNQVGAADQGVKINCAGINLGYGNVKVQTDQGYFQYISDTNPARDRKTRERFGIDDARTQLVTYDGKLWEVGDGAGLLAAPRQRKTIFPFWAGTLPYMVLRQSILDRLAQQGTEWFVTVGVPINEMRNEEYVDKVKALWLGEFMTCHGPIRIHRASVVSEPSGALFYYGTTVTPIDTLRSQNLTILDWGYLTTLGTTHRRLLPDLDNTIHVEMGVSKVAEHVTEAIRRKYKDERDVVEVERAMLGQFDISIDGQPIEMRPLVMKAVEDEGPKILDKVRTQMPNPASRIFIVGGGAHLFQTLIQGAFDPDRYRVDFAGQPQKANAIGLHSSTRYQLEQVRASGRLQELMSAMPRQEAA